MLGAGPGGPCCGRGTEVAVHTEGQGSFEGELRSAGRLSRNGWGPVVEACRKGTTHASSYLLVGRGMIEVVPHSVYRGAGQARSQTRLGSPPSQDGRQVVHVE